MSKVINTKELIADILDDSTDRGRWFSWAMQGVIILSLLSLSAGTVPDIPQHAKDILFKINVACMFVFVTEYSFRVYTAKNVFKYIFSFYGLVDVLAIAPYFMGISGIDSQSIRAFRLLRIFQLFKMVRYARAMGLYYRAFKIAREEMIFFSIVSAIIFYVASVGIYHFEHVAQPEAFKSVLHSLWWAIITLSTVGYGDVYPVTAGGKVFTGFVIIIGIGIVSVPAAMLASALSEARRQEGQ